MIPQTARLLLIATTVVLATQFVAQVSAQRGIAEPWARPYEIPFRSIWSDPLVRSVADWFDMTDEQRLLLDAFSEEHKAKFDAFRHEHEPIRDSYDDRIEANSLTPLQRHEIRVEREEELAKVADTQEALDMQFLPAIQSILQDEQFERWDEFIWWLNRKRWITGPAQYLEQRIDLILLLDQLATQSASKLDDLPDELILEYGRQMDHALREHVAFTINFSRNRMRANKDRYRTDGERVWLDAFAPDPDKLRRETEKRLSLQRRVRDLNQTYARLLASTLPEPEATFWRRLYRESVLRHVVVNSALGEETNDLIRRAVTGAPRLIRLVGDIRETVEDLDVDQRAALDSLVAQHDSSLSAWFGRVVTAHDAVADSRFGGTDSNTRTALEERYRQTLESIVQIEKRFMDSVLNVMTPAQREIIDSLEEKSNDGAGRTGPR